MSALVLLAALSQFTWFSIPVPLAVDLKTELQHLAKQPLIAQEIRSSNAFQLLQQGWNLYQSEQFSQAVTVLQQANQAFQAQGDSLGQAQTLNYLSMTYQELGQWNNAAKAIADGLTLLHPGKSKQHLSILAKILNTQGKLELTLGQSQKALTSWDAANTAYTRIGDADGIVISQINQAQALQNLGLYRRALIALTQANHTLQQQPDSLLKATGLLSLGNVLRIVGDLDQKDSNATELSSLGSQQVLEQSLAVAQRIHLPELVAEIQLSLGKTAQVRQKTEAALDFYRQAAAPSASPMTRLQAQLNQLQITVDMEQWANANTLLPIIQSGLVALPPSRKTIYTQIDLAQILMHQGRFRLREVEKAKAQLCPSAPINICTSAQLLATAAQEAKILGDERAEAEALGNLGKVYEQTQQFETAKSLTQQALILAQAINASDISYRWQWQLGRLLKAQGDISGAIAAYTQAVTTLKSLRSDLVAINPDVQFSFRDEVEPIYRQLVDLLLQSNVGEQPKQQNLVQARAAIESLQLAELDNFFRTTCLEGKPVNLDQVVEKEDPTAAVVYPIVLANRLEVILKLPNQPLRHYKTAVTQSQVEKLSQELTQKLTLPYTLREVQFLSQQVYDWLIRPAEADLAKSRIKTLVFVLDNALRNIPMAALYDGQQYLVQKYAVALTPGLQLLPPKPIEQVRLKALTAGLTEAHQGFSALTNVAAELKSIKAEVSSTELLNQKFTSTSLQTEINSIPFSVVHLATHGQFSSQANQTFILAWDKPIMVNELSNLLRTRDTSIRNPIELLVLSACETASGDKRATLGLAGVAVQAGARSTLASLWSLDDQSSALVIGQFYQELANTKVTKAEALRRAQMAVLQNPRYQHPRYWSPFVLVGNWL